MLETLNKIRTQVVSDLETVQSTAELEALQVKALGKKGELTALLKSLGKLPQEERPAMGAAINEARKALQERIDLRAQELKRKERDEALRREAIDVTEPRKLPEIGTAHPITIVMNEMIECFTGMGFEVLQGSEVELEYYNFELMNIPKNHPARDAQDTLYIDDNIVLRTHTSPMQARVMLARKPPIRIVCPGRVYRADELDASHSPVFHQMEGLVVDEHISMADLRGTLDAFAKHIYGADVNIRFRPSFFPFTEPSAEVDLTCSNCKGTGCKVCKGTGWIEILGSGMVNPKVLDMCGIDSQKYSGFAFGIGLDRIAMGRFAIPDMRLLFEGDARLLSQLR
ncbi:MAG: phenylalanine--tRNA ligase subunit alpha [Clostridiales bacterium]|nr:phenylalanine--tRNA ligase subunit alpha [Clostridiales bacterium]